jgi:hypothetical protein
MQRAQRKLKVENRKISRQEFELADGLGRPSYKSESERKNVPPLHKAPRVTLIRRGWPTLARSEILTTEDTQNTEEEGSGRCEGIGAEQGEGGRRGREAVPRMLASGGGEVRVSRSQIFWICGEVGPGAFLGGKGRHLNLNASERLWTWKGTEPFRLFWGVQDIHHREHREL